MTCVSLYLLYLKVKLRKMLNILLNVTVIGSLCIYVNSIFFFVKNNPISQNKNW